MPARAGRSVGCRPWEWSERRSRRTIAPPPVDFTRDLIRWSESLAGIARTGLGFTQSLYEQERYEEVLKVAADIKAAADDALEVRREQDHFVQEWLESVGEGVPGYVTPKVAVGAIVGNDEGQLLLVQRADSGIWLYPTGWADVGYSPAEVALKEVQEETGVVCEPVQLLAVIDGLRMGFTRFGMYMVLFHCRAIGGELQAHPLETSGVGLVRSGRAAPHDRRRGVVGADGLRRDPRRAHDGLLRPARPTSGGRAAEALAICVVVSGRRPDRTSAVAQPPWSRRKRSMSSTICSASASGSSAPSSFDGVVGRRRRPRRSSPISSSRRT